MVIAMVISFSKCGNGIEVLFFIALCVCIVLSIVSAIGVYANEKDMKGKDAITNELLSGISVFFTDKYLTERGRKWRPFYVFSILFLIILIVAGLVLKPCT